MSVNAKKEGFVNPSFLDRLVRCSGFLRTYGGAQFVSLSPLVLGLESDLLASAKERLSYLNLPPHLLKPDTRPQERYLGWEDLGPHLGCEEVLHGSMVGVMF